MATKLKVTLVRSGINRREPQKLTIAKLGLGKRGRTVVLRPASPGTGVIAGGAVRPMLEVAGVQDILTKCIGTSNPHNVIHATIDALKKLHSGEALASLRGKRLDEITAAG